jgi:hypothetical protein
LDFCGEVSKGLLQIFKEVTCSTDFYATVSVKAAVRVVEVRGREAAAAAVTNPAPALAAIVFAPTPSVDIENRMWLVNAALTVSVPSAGRR